jgi:hypothetical protein
MRLISSDDEECGIPGQAAKRKVVGWQHLRQRCLEPMVGEGWCELGDVPQSREQTLDELGPVIVKISETVLHQLCERSVLS